MTTPCFRAETRRHRSALSSPTDRRRQAKQALVRSLPEAHDRLPPWDHRDPQSVHDGRCDGRPPYAPASSSAAERDTGIGVAVGVPDGQGPPAPFALRLRRESAPPGVDGDERLLRAGDEADQVRGSVVDLDDVSPRRVHALMKPPTVGKAEVGQALRWSESRSRWTTVRSPELHAFDHPRPCPAGESVPPRIGCGNSAGSAAHPAARLRAPRPTSGCSPQPSTPPSRATLPSPESTRGPPSPQCLSPRRLAAPRHLAGDVSLLAVIGYQWRARQRSAA
jgi:hypothetical protein